MPKNNIDLIKELLIEVSINKDKKDVLIRKINKIESELENHNLKYKDIAIKFIEDIKGDIEEGREINIDSTNNDEYVENFFKTKLETQNYNRLILEDSYKNIFNNIYSNNNLVFLENEFKKIENNFVNYYEKLKTDVIAQNLLIYTSFKRKNVHQALNRLGVLFKTIGYKNGVTRVNKLTNMLTVLNYEIKNKGLYFYKKGKYNYKYISFRNSEGGYMLSDNIIDTSKHNFRTGNPKFEYKNLIKNIKK